MRLLNRLNQYQRLSATFSRKAANRHRQRTGRTLFLQRTPCSYAVASGTGGGMAGVAGAVRTRKARTITLSGHAGIATQCDDGTGTETGKQQDVLELAQLAPCELRTLLQPLYGRTMAKRYTHVAYSLYHRPLEPLQPKLFARPCRAASRRADIFPA